MMAATREQAIEALAARLATAYAFGTVTRRVTSPTTLGQPGAPGLGIVVHHESYHRPALNVPPRRTMFVSAIVYVATGNNANAIPDAILNPIKDAIDAALARDNFATGFCTLGGVVEACGIRGEVVQAPGDQLGQGLALIPIEIVLP